jgi:UDP-N-acetylglucosamine:LPS N-acetylglucosamine transferase
MTAARSSAPVVVARDGHGSEYAPVGGRIVIVSASVGAGHDGPADELGRRLHARGWWVDRPDGLRILPGRFGPGLRRLYLAGLRRTPSLWGPVLDSCADGLGARIVHGALDELTERTSALLGERPDAVVSTYPLVSQLLGRLRQRGLLDVPVISYLTDPAVHPLWWHPGVDLVLAPHPSMTAQIRRLAEQLPGDGTCSEIVETAPAMPLAFRVPADDRDVAAVRAELGVPPGRVLALVTAGSAGTGPVHRTAADLASWGAWPVVLCARNDRQRRRLRAFGAGRALGWVDDVPRLLRAADVVVDNAGGLACAEAVAAGRPVISYRMLPGHGEANAAVLHDAGLVPWARTREDLGVLLDRRAERGAVQRPALVDPARVVHGVALESRGSHRSDIHAGALSQS